MGTCSPLAAAGAHRGRLGGIHAVAQDLSLVALSLEDHVLLPDGAGQRLARLPASVHGPTTRAVACSSAMAGT
jgi:hypothetical protein